MIMKTKQNLKLKAGRLGKWIFLVVCAAMVLTAMTPAIGICAWCYPDNDGDGYGDKYATRVSRPSCGLGWSSNKTDCNDSNEDIHPGAAEICDGADNDCDGSTDEGAIGNTYYRDADGDGYGTPGTTIKRCTQPAGYVTDNTDCNDSKAAIHPGAADNTCDAVDNDCDGTKDEDATGNTYYRDADGDTYGDPDNTINACTRPTGYVTNNTDCNDGNAAIKPGANDNTCNGVDNDCDGSIDENAPRITYYQDADADGYGNASITQSACSQPTGYVTNATDCNDGDAAIHPGSNDNTCNGVDENCSGAPDENAPKITYYFDGDGDGYGNPSLSVLSSSCATPAGYVTNNTDCNDGSASIHPGVDEICDGQDNNCVDGVDENFITNTYYRDMDGDTYGDSSSHMNLCAPSGEYNVTDISEPDCDDHDPNVHPAAYDDCGNGIDEDCSGADRVCGGMENVCANLADAPLETQVEAPPPIVMLLMDDSGSMNYDVLCPEEGGEFRGYTSYGSVTKYWQSQFAGYNGVYYNPQMDYVPWPDSFSTEYDDADPDYPRSHPNVSTSPRELNSQFLSFDGVSVRWAHYYVWSTTGNCPYLINIEGSGGSYSLTYYKVDACLNGACSESKSYVNDYVLTATPPADVAVTGKTPAEVRQNFANWYQYYRTRRLTAVASIGNMVNTVEDVQIGLHAINRSINLIVPRLVNTYRGQILDDLYDVGASGYTPLQRGLWEVGQFYMGNVTEKPSPYSSEEGGECQQAYTIMMTDGYWNQSFSSVGNADGAVNTDQINGFDGGEFADNVSNTVADTAMYFYERDLNPDLENMVSISAKDTATHQHMVTYTISYGLAGVYNPLDYPNCPGTNCPAWPDPLTTATENKENITDLWHAAVNGRGAFMEATNAMQLAYALTNMMQDVSQRQGSGASVAVNSHELKEGTRMYQGTYNSAGWTGDLRAYDINTDGTVNQTPAWSAAAILDARVTASGHEDRDIFTMGASGGIAFTSANITSLTTAQRNFLGEDATARANLVNFIRGDYSKDKNHNGGLRSRITRLSDIVHSEPKYVNGYLYAGANDGMLHVFNAADGQEVFAYIPSFVYPNLEELSNPDYTHRYFVDSTPFLGYFGSDVLLISGLGKGGKGYFCLDVDINTPGSFTAADVKWEYPDAGSTSTEVDNMGYTFSEPVIIETETAGKLLIFGNGYDSPNAKAVLYVLDPTTGNMLKMIDTGFGGPTSSNCNGLSTPVFIDANNNGKADFAYAGDLKGNVWKFDIRGAVANWAVAYGTTVNPKPLFRALDSSGNPQPITTRLAVKGHCVKGYSGYIVVFGTGKFNSSGDYTSASTQAVYGIWDWAPEWVEEGGTGPDKYFGAFNSPSTGNLSNVFANLPGVGSKLTLLGQSQPGNPVTIDGKDWSFTSSNAITWFDVKKYLAGGYTLTDGYHVGWTFALPVSGERVVADPILWMDYVLIVSQVPADNMCTVGGTSYLTAMNSCSGKAPDGPFFDTNNDNEITDADTINDDIPNKIKLKDFITYSPTMIEDFIYFGPGESYVVDTDPSRVIFWRYLNID